MNMIFENDKCPLTLIEACALIRTNTVHEGLDCEMVTFRRSQSVNRFVTMLVNMFTSTYCSLVTLYLPVPDHCYIITKMI